MEYFALTASPCGCIRLFRGETPPPPITIIDSNMRPFGAYYVEWLELGPDRHNIQMAFISDAAFLNYLNTTFVALYGYEGIFYLSEDDILYSNNENFLNAEMMLVFGSMLIVLPVGNPEFAPTLQGGPGVILLDAVANGSSFSFPELFDLALLGLRVGNYELQPIAGQGGYTPYSEDPDISGNGRVDTNEPVEDNYLYFYASQKPQQ